MRHLPLIALITLALSCASAPPVKHPDLDLDVPESWTTPADGAVPSTGPWWSAFDDDALAALIEEALEHNHDLRAAVARLDQARATSTIARAGLLPSADVSLDARRQKINFIGFPIPNSSSDVLTTRSTQLQLALNTRWELDLWGRIRSGQEAAIADLQAAELDLAALRESLAARVTTSWFLLLEARQQLELARRSEQSYRQNVEWIRQRYRSGLRTPLDLRLAESLVSSATALVARRQQQLDEASRQIEILLGRYPAGELDAAESLPALPPEIPGGLPAELLSRRPDVLRAERQLAASRARIREARASLYPRLALTASAGTSTEKLEDLLNGDFSVWSIAGNLVQPLFEGGRLRAQVRVAEAGEDQVLSAYANTLLTAFGEVEGALTAEHYLAVQEKSLREAHEQAREAQRLSRDQYRSGLSSLLIYLESQRQAIQAEQQWITVKRLRLEARVALHLALGGTFGQSIATAKQLAESSTSRSPDS